MDHFTSTENARPWWADVAHLRDDAGPSAAASTVTAPISDPHGPAGLQRRRPERSPGASRFESDRFPGDRFAPRDRATRMLARDGSTAGAARARTTRPIGERPSTDWFADEARNVGRRATPQPTSEPARPRVTLVDVSPDHVLRTRAPQVRRAPGERPTVTITGRPDAGLPVHVPAPEAESGRRARRGAASLAASPDRMMLWAVALGLLMILASIGTASADAATALTLLP